MSVPSASEQELRHIASALSALLPALHRALDRRLAVEYPHPKPPEGQLALLRLVGEHDGITVRAAADVLLMKPNNVSALVTQLTAQGLLERAQDPADRRVAHLRLTPEARRRTAEVDALTSEYVAGALRALTDGDIAAMGSALGALQGLARHLHPTSP